MLRVFFFLGVLNIGFLYGQTSDSLTEVNTSIKDTLKQGLFRVQQMEEHERVKEVGVTNRTWPMQDGERKRKSECWAMIKRV